MFMHAPDSTTSTECTDKFEAPVTDTVLGLVDPAAGVLWWMAAARGGQGTLLWYSPALIVGGIVHLVSAHHGFSVRDECIDAKRRAGK